MQKKVLILINKISDNPSEDELDVLVQANEIEKSLRELGYNSTRQFMDLDLKSAGNAIADYSPDFVFNLVESLDNKGNLIFLAPALLESLKVPYTGCSLEAMFLTSNKLLAKKLMKSNNISTPSWIDPFENNEPDPSKYYIAKPLWEDASVGITDESVFKGDHSDVIDEFRRKWGKSFFAEEFIEGREFNISVLAGEVMPLAEIEFLNFPEDKPKIVGYKAKWDESTFEYQNTLRSFNLTEVEVNLKNDLSEMALKCWDIFNLRGYARVDFRSDIQNRAFVLEINSNPCISPDAGFFAACAEKGMSYTDMVRFIINDIN